MRWPRYLEKRGNTLQKQNEIYRYIWSDFVKHHREYRVTIIHCCDCYNIYGHDRDLRVCAMDKAIEVGLKIFKAFDRFVAYFNQ